MSTAGDSTPNSIPGITPNGKTTHIDSPTTFPNPFRVPQILTTIVILLTAAASGGGLFLPGLYRDPAVIVPVLRGQDLVTLLTLPVVFLAMRASRRGSIAALLVWIGLMGYLFYCYTVAAFSYHLNSFCLIYAALFSLSIFTLITAAAGLDMVQIQKRFDGAAPRLPVILFLTFLAIMLVAIELKEIGRFIFLGETPPIMQRTGGTSYPIYPLDLGMIVPLSFLSTIWLWRRKPWGYVISGFLLIKAATMGLSLISMNVFSWRAGQPTDGPLNALWAAIATGGLTLSFLFFRPRRQ